MVHDMMEPAGHSSHHRNAMRHAPHVGSQWRPYDRRMWGIHMAFYLSWGAGGLIHRSKALLLRYLGELMALAELPHPQQLLTLVLAVLQACSFCKAYPYTRCL